MVFVWVQSVPVSWSAFWSNEKLGIRCGAPSDPLGLIVQNQTDPLTAKIFWGDPLDGTKSAIIWGWMMGLPAATHHVFAAEPTTDTSNVSWVL